MGGVPNILLVEDHADTAAPLARLLRLEGYAVVVADGFRSAVAAASNHTFDLLVCDIGLPDGDGCDLLRLLRERHQIGGIAFSGYGMPADVERFRNAGFLSHLIKPAPFASLNAAIIEALAVRAGIVAGTTSRAAETASHSSI